MTAAQLEGSSIARDLEFLEMLDRWMALDPDERASFIQQIRDEVPGAVELADAFERHHRSLLARAGTSQAAA